MCRGVFEARGFAFVGSAAMEAARAAVKAVARVVVRACVCSTECVCLWPNERVFRPPRTCAGAVV